MAVAAAAGVVVVLFMALPFFVESAPRAYRLKAGNAATLLFQHSSGHPPCNVSVTSSAFMVVHSFQAMMYREKSSRMVDR